MNRISRLILLTTFAALAAPASPGWAQTKDAVKAATDRMNAIKAATGAKPSAHRLPPGDPCTVMPLSTVQGVLPAVKVAERSTRLEDLAGMTECQWKSGTGDVQLVLHESYDRGDSAKADAIDMADMYTGMSGAAKNVRIETFPTIGVDNAAFAEVRDPARNLKNDIAFVSVRKGDHIVTLGAPGMAGRDRSQALKGLEVLGRQMASRL